MCTDSGLYTFLFGTFAGAFAWEIDFHNLFPVPVDLTPTRKLHSRKESLGQVGI